MLGEFLIDNFGEFGKARSVATGALPTAMIGEIYAAWC